MLGTSEKYNAGPLEEISRSITTEGKNGVIEWKKCGGKWDKLHDISRRTLQENDCEAGDTIDAFNKRVNKDGCSPTITTRPEGLKTEILPVTSDYRIRKLTERECFRLMGVKGEDFEKIAKSQSMSSLYHLAGDSIVTACLMAIFGLLLEVD